MERCAVFVDAGWFLAEAAQALTGRGARGSVDCDYARLTAALGQLGEQVTRLPLLRIYWYDAGADGVPCADHLDIATMRNVKLRLGRISHSQQKGVDALLILDLTTLARERAIASAFVISGDEDIREGIAVAQSLGVRVTIGGVAVPAGRPSVATTLIREADDQYLMDVGTLSQSIRVRQTQAPPARIAIPAAPEPMPVPGLEPVGAAGLGNAVELAASPGHAPATPQHAEAGLRAWDPRRFGEDFGANYADGIDDSDLRQLQREAPQIPADIAAQLFRQAEEVFGETRGRTELRRELRMGFWDHVMRRRNS